MEAAKLLRLIATLFGIQAAATIPLQQNNAGQKSVIDRSETAEIFAEPGVFLTVNALASVAAGGNYLDRMLELNWYNFQILDGDWIGLFNYDPSINEVDHKQNALAIITPLTSEGTSKTSIRFAREDLNETYNSIKQNSCLGYWISYFKGSSPNVASSVNCIRRFPTWMNDLKDVIGDTPLTALMIPGTHDAGAWKLYAGRPDDNVVIAYTINQEETIYNQLIHGIRYLDVRVAHYPATEEKYFINHGDFRIRPIISLFEDVKRFVAETNEIVLMDFHNFPVGFHNSTDHENLLQFVLLHMGDVLVKKSVVGLNPTPNAIWATTASVVLTYSEDSISTKYSYLFPNLRHAWGNTNKMDELETYLAGAHNQYGCSGQFWSSMAELTPVTNDIILRPNFGLRGFAQLVNIPVTQWYRREAWYSKSNIISTDFFLGNNIIEMSVAVNQKRASCPRCVDEDCNSSTTSHEITVTSTDDMTDDPNLTTAKATNPSTTATSITNSSTTATSITNPSTTAISITNPSTTATGITDDTIDPNTSSMISDPGTTVDTSGTASFYRFGMPNLFSTMLLAILNV